MTTSAHEAARINRTLLFRPIQNSAAAMTNIGAKLATSFGFE